MAAKIKVPDMFSDPDPSQTISDNIINEKHMLTAYSTEETDRTHPILSGL